MSELVGKKCCCDREAVFTCRRSFVYCCHLGVVKPGSGEVKRVPVCACLRKCRCRVDGLLREDSQLGGRASNLSACVTSSGVCGRVWICQGGDKRNAFDVTRDESLMECRQRMKYQESIQMQRISR